MGKRMEKMMRWKKFPTYEVGWRMGMNGAIPVPDARG